MGTLDWSKNSEILRLRIIVLVRTPVAKKVQTATKDRRLSLGIPHNPCPLVHPLLSLVPKPTSKPARPNPNRDVPAVISSTGPKG